MKKIYFKLFVLQLVVFGAYCQRKYADVVPPSPNASSIAKYGDIPVSLFTGSHSVNIPFFEFSTQNVKVPVGISYHASGIKVGEDASNIGAGWALYGGGVITRTVRGLADEEDSFGYLRHTTDLSIIPSSETAQRNLYNKIMQEELDAEPDLYNFNFLGKSAKFIVKKVSASTIEGYATDGSNIKIQWMLLPPNNNKFQWIITDTDGTRYFFGQAGIGDSNQKSCETSVSQSVTYAKVGRNESKAYGNQRLFPSAWYLKQIILTNGEQVNFSYIDYTTKVCGLSNENNVFAYGSSEECGKLSENRATINKTDISGKKLLSIDFPNGRVDFSYTSESRKDLANSTDNYLDRVSLSTPSGELIKYFELTHSYFNLNSINNKFNLDCPVPEKGKLRLDAVQEFGKNGASVHPYNFTYEGISLPHTLSFAQDHWGFFNGQDDNTTLIPEYAVFLNSQSQLDILQGAKRFSNYNFAKRGILTSIKYPTGGQTFFNYETHQAWTKDFDFEVNTESTCSETITLSRSDLAGNSMIANKPLIVNGTQCYNNVLGQWFEFNAYSPTPCSWNQRGQGGCGTNLILLGTNFSFFLNGLTNYKKFLPNGNYTLRFQVLDIDYAPTDISLSVCRLSQSQSLNNAFSEYSPENLSMLCSTVNPDYNKTIGGLRIASVVNKDGNNVVSVIKYKYSKQNSAESSGKLIKIPKYSYTSEHIDAMVNLCYEYNRSSFSQVPTFASNGNHVEYSYVEEVKTENEIAEKGIRTGHSFYTFSFPNITYPFAQPNSFDTRRGKLLEQFEYKLNLLDNTYKPVKSGSMIYEFGDERFKPVNYSIKAGCIAYSDAVGIGTAGCTTFTFGQSTNEVDWTYLKERKEKIYDPSDESKFVLSRDRFEFNNPNFRQVSTQKRIDSKSQLINSLNDTYNREIVTNYKYTFDFPASTIYSEMINRNIIDIVEEKTELIESSTSKLLSQNRTTFGKWNVSTNYGGINGFFEPISIESWLEVIDDSHRNKFVQFINYDQLGNLLSYRESNNSPVNFTYYNEVGKKNLLKTQTKAAETSVALTTTYDYYPLVGIRSIKQPDNLMTFYEYDNLNRLEFIKDNFGKLVKRYQYNYATPTAAGTAPAMAFSAQLDARNEQINLSFAYPTSSVEVVKYEIQRGQGNEPLKPWVTVDGDDTTKIDPSYTPNQNIYKYEIRAVLSNGTVTEWKPLNLNLPNNCTGKLQLIKNGVILATKPIVDKACYELILDEGFETQDNADYTGEIEN